MSCHDPDHMEMPATCSRCGDYHELNDFPYNRAGTELVCGDCLHDVDELGEEV